MNALQSNVNYEDQLGVLLEEFRSNRDIHLQLENQIATFLTVMAYLLSGILVFLSQVNISNKLYMLLILSMIFSAFGLGIGFRLRQFFTIHLYERLVLRPKIEKLLQIRHGNQSISVLELEEFTGKTLNPKNFILKSIFGIQAAALSLLAICISIGFVISFFIIKGSFILDWKYFEPILVLISIVLILIQCMGYLFTLLLNDRELQIYQRKLSTESSTTHNKERI